jgi:hypothetical protein
MLRDEGFVEGSVGGSVEGVVEGLGFLDLRFLQGFEFRNLRR